MVHAPSVNTQRPIFGTSLGAVAEARTKPSPRARKAKPVVSAETLEQVAHSTGEREKVQHSRRRTRAR